MLQLSCNFGKSTLSTDLVLVVMNSFATNYVLNEHEDFRHNGQRDAILQLSVKFSESTRNFYWVIMFMVLLALIVPLTSIKI